MNCSLPVVDNKGIVNPTSGSLKDAFTPRTINLTDPVLLIQCALRSHRPKRPPALALPRYLRRPAVASASNAGLFCLAVNHSTADGQTQRQVESSYSFITLSPRTILAAMRRET